MYERNLLLYVLLLVSHIHACDSIQPKQLRVHFDINKTIIATDAVQAKDVETTVNGILAECMIAPWNGNNSQSYYAYVTDQISQECPFLARTDDVFKHKRTQRLKQFPVQVKQQYPEQYALYEQEKAAMMHVLQNSPTGIFPSFYQTMQWLATQYPNRYAVYLRTFGTDLPAVVSTIQKNSSLRFANQEADLTQSIPRIALLRMVTNQSLCHYAIRDDYICWKAHDFQVVGGKPFPIHLDDPDTLSIFFDDNAQDPDKQIICPLKPNGELEDTKKLLASGHIVAVNPRDAILDVNYFINKIKALL
ncbi:MAG TPA: hypothetical protein VGW78_07280 [Candidatus Babeliales bacterium]|jgi:hypothetical protein|nr:hypothetical protein [Candidatus Babeliales bacterium]